MTAVNGKQIGNGTTLACQFSTTGSTTYTVIEHLIDTDGPGTAGNDIELATLNSTSPFIDYCRGDVDPGELTFTLAFGSTNTGHKELGTANVDGLNRTWKVTPPTTTDAETFSGYVKAIGKTITRNTMITRALTVKVSGDPGIATT